MSIRTELKNAIYHTKNISHDTQKTKMLQVARFADFLKDANIQIKSIKSIKVKHLQAYVDTQKAANKSSRTIQNELATIRTVLHQAGRSDFANNELISNKSLGVSGASRAGTNSAMTKEAFSAAQNALTAKGSNAESAALGLMYSCGLRSKEAVMSSASLSSWKNEIEKTGKMTVIYGTKGGRKRIVDVSYNKDEVLNAIEKAQDVISENASDYLVVGKGGTLESARDRLHHQISSVLKDTDFSCHSARYSFAQNQVDTYKTMGYITRDAFALASLDLGHGSSRWRYIQHVYDQR